MEVRPGYKQSDVGVIPMDWEVDFIENLAHIKTGGKNTQDRIEDGQYPFFVRSQTVERINSYSFDGEAILTAGDGVGTGKVFHYINGRFDVHQRVYRISNFSARLNGYFFYLYFSTHFYNRIMQMTAKSSVDSVRMAMISRMPVPLPPTESEQCAIAAALWDVNALLGGLERLIDKKRALKQATMQQLLSGQTRLPGFHGEWELGVLADVVEALVAGVSVNSTDDDPSPGTPCVLKTSALSSGVFLSGEAKRIAPQDRFRARLNPKRDTILISRMNTPDLVGEIAYVEQDYPWLFLPDRVWMTQFRGNSNLSVRWLAYVLSSSEYKKLIRGAATGTSGSMKNIAKDALLSLPVRFPQSEEQTAIAAILSDMDAELSALEERHDKIRDLKQAMMQELLTGKTRLVPIGDTACLNSPAPSAARRTA